MSRKLAVACTAGAIFLAGIIWYISATASLEGRYPLAAATTTPNITPQTTPVSSAKQAIAQSSNSATQKSDSQAIPDLALFNDELYTPKALLRDDYIDGELRIIMDDENYAYFQDVFKSIGGTLYNPNLDLFVITGGQQNRFWQEYSNGEREVAPSKSEGIIAMHQDGRIYVAFLRYNESTSTHMVYYFTNAQEERDRLKSPSLCKWLERNETIMFPIFFGNADNDETKIQGIYWHPASQPDGSYSNVEVFPQSGGDTKFVFQFDGFNGEVVKIEVASKIRNGYARFAPGDFYEAGSIWTLSFCGDYVTIMCHDIADDGIINSVTVYEKSPMTSSSPVPNPTLALTPKPTPTPTLPPTPIPSVSASPAPTATMVPQLSARERLKAGMTRDNVTNLFMSVGATPGSEIANTDVNPVILTSIWYEDGVTVTLRYEMSNLILLESWTY